MIFTNLFGDAKIESPSTLRRVYTLNKKDVQEKVKVMIRTCRDHQ